MTIYIDKLNVKLNAILSKDKNAILSKRVYIPFLGTNYTMAQLQAWLKDRSDIIDNIKTMDEAQILAYRTTAYNGLCANCKVIADGIIAGTGPGPGTPDTALHWVRLCIITLCIFGTTP